MQMMTTYLHLLLLYVLTLVKTDKHAESLQVPVHRLLSRRERSYVFGSQNQVPNYEVIYLPVEFVLWQRLKRDLGTDCPPLRLNVSAFGEEVQLQLIANSNLFFDELLVVTRETNATYIHPQLNGAKGACYYHGKVLSSTGGKTAVTLLNQGYTGIIAKNKGPHLIFHPLPERLQKRDANLQDLVPHIIYEKKNLPEEACHHSTNNPKTQQLSRKRRKLASSSPSRLHIETAVFVDRELHKLMQERFPADSERGTVDVVLTMINAAQLLFQDPSLGIDIEIALIRLEIQTTEFEGLQRTGNIDRYLSNFCSWQSKINPINDNDPLHWDHALLLTGFNVYSEDAEGIRNNQVVGLAPVSGMCLHGNSCTVNEGGHFESVYVIAHEMGHSMGMQHDGLQNNNNCDKNKYIMSPTLGSGKTTWSSCSRNYLMKFLRSPQSRCLWDPGLTPEQLNHVKNLLLPGQRFNADQQCRLRFGSRSNRAIGQPLETVCQDLQCTTEQFVISSHPALEGTQCGDRRYCRRGKCVIMPTTKPKPIDGGWSEWSLFTPCASGCLYGNDGALDTGSTGIRISYRSCDNPHPESGGKFCSGKDRRYQICNATQSSCQMGPKLTIDAYAGTLCIAVAAIHRELTGDGFQQMNYDREKACSTWCFNRTGEPYTSKNFYFPDGTACSIPNIKNPTYCVNGICQEFGCDGRTIDDSTSPNCPIVNSTSYLAQITQPEFRSWVSTSSCMFGCMAGGRGIQTVQPTCHTVGICPRNQNYIQLCDSYKKCVILQPASQYAFDLCQSLSKMYPQLSGIGEQLRSADDDPNLRCYVACQDAFNTSKYYKIDNIPSGMFPVGTDCKKTNHLDQELCLQGHCLTFGADDITSYSDDLKEVFRKRRNVPKTNHEILQVGNWNNSSTINILPFEQQPRISSSHTSKGLSTSRSVEVVSFAEALASNKVKTFPKKSKIEDSVDLQKIDVS